MSTIAVNAITDANGGSTTSINGTTPNAYNLVGKNKIINGNFAIAQRGTSFTTDNIYTLDRWFSSDGSGGSPARTLSQETFTLGQTDVPNAYYYARHNQTSATPNGNSSLVQKIEDVTQFDGQTITLSFYAKADAAMDIDIRFIQDFGTGGSPSSDVTVTETVSISTSWTKYTVTTTLGSLSGKTLGTDGVHTTFLQVNMEFQPTTTFTFDIAQVQLELGESATEFEHRPYGLELSLCQRYYQSLGDSTVLYVTTQFNSTNHWVATSFVTSMRANPTITKTVAGTIIQENVSPDAVSWAFNSSGTYLHSVKLDAEL